MTDKQLKNILTILSLILGIPALFFSIVSYVRDLPVYWTILIGTIFIVGLNWYLKYSLKTTPRSGEVGEPRFPAIHKSKLTRYSLFILPIISILACVMLYYIGESRTAEDINRGFSSNELELPCKSISSIDRSICVAKFSPEAFDNFSQSLILDLSGKMNENELRLIDHDEFVYAGRNEKQQIDSIQYMHCIDTGIIVHGMRSSEDSVFYCKIHFLNYDRNDTLIDNPNQIEFSYKGHVKYLSDFLLGHDRNDREEYRYALNLFLDARNVDGTDEFRAVVDYYIGNVYFQMNQLDSARMYYDLAAGTSSIVYDYAVEKLLKIDFHTEDVFVDENLMLKEVSSNKSDIERIRIVSMLNNQFITHASKYFKVKERYEDSVKYGEFVEITANLWNPQKNDRFKSKWVLFRNDSLYYFEMTTSDYDKSLKDLNFKSSISKKWSIPAKGLVLIDFVLRSPQRRKRGGWDVCFKGNNSRKVGESKISYDYLYSPVIARDDPLQKTYYTFVRNETERVGIIDGQLRKLLDRYKLNYTLRSSIKVDDLE